MREQLQGFITFVREQGVVGLAIGFILGGAVSAVVSSLVKDVINPLVAYAFSGIDTLGELTVGTVRLGNFVIAFIDFLILAAVVYFIFRGLGLDMLDKKKA